MKWSGCGTSETQMNVNYKWSRGTSTWGAGRGRGRGEGLIWNSQDNSLGRGQTGAGREYETAYDLSRSAADTSDY